MMDDVLQRLRQDLRPAFLWDAGRCRVVWANAAAVQLFGARGLGDLVERPFSPREPGVRLLQQMHERLGSANAAAAAPAPVHVALEFPSTGKDEPLVASVVRHALPDGRPGLLVVAEERPRTADVPVLSDILESMPQPVLALTPAGEPAYANPAALELLSFGGAGGQKSLTPAQLFAGERALHDFLWRVRQAGTAVVSRETFTRFGPRILRITGRMAEDGLIILMLDDLTDRLRAEQGGMLPVSMFSMSMPGQAVHQASGGHNMAGMAAPSAAGEAAAPAMPAAGAAADAGAVPPEAMRQDRQDGATEGVAKDAAQAGEGDEAVANARVAGGGGLRPQDLKALRRLAQALEEQGRAPQQARQEQHQQQEHEEQAQLQQESDMAEAAADSLPAGTPGDAAPAQDGQAAAAPAPEDADAPARREAPARKRYSIRVRKVEPRDDEDGSGGGKSVPQEGAETGESSSSPAREQAGAPRVRVSIPARPVAASEAQPEDARDAKGSGTAEKAEKAEDGPAVSPPAQEAADADASGAMATDASSETPEVAESDDGRDEGSESGDVASVLASDPALRPPSLPAEDSLPVDEGGAEAAEAGSNAPAVGGDAVEDAAKAEEEPAQRPQPPQLVRDVLDHRLEPIILHRAESFYFANRVARELFGFAEEDEAWDDMARTLTLAQDGAIVALRNAAGRRLTFRLKRDVFPWRAGVVVQSTLQAASAAAPDDEVDAAPGGNGAAAGKGDAAGMAPGAVAAGESATASAGNAQGALHRASAPSASSAAVIRIHAERPRADASTRRGTGIMKAGMGLQGPVARMQPCAPQPDGGPAETPVDARQDIADAAGVLAREEGDRSAAGKAEHAPAAETAQESRKGQGAAAGTMRRQARESLPARQRDDNESSGMDEQLRAMLETAADGIITLDAQGRILSFSAGARQLFGREPSQVLGHPFEELLAEESRPALAARLQRLREGDGISRDRGQEVLGLTGEGEAIPLYMTLGRLRHAQPRAQEDRAAFCVVVHDISPFKRRERALRRAKEEAEELSARKSEFLARISHELRTPLNAILGFSDVLRQELYGRLGNEKYLDYARDIYHSGEHLLALVNDLLDLARIEAGRYELQMQEVDVAAVVEESVSLLREQAAEAGIELRRVVPDELPKVVADARSLKQVLLNLLSNSIKFCRSGDRLIITLKVLADGGLELSVKDTGPGMSEEELKMALEPFRRVPRTGADKPGTGLGLPLARALTQANRARFEIDSRPGEGTEVRIIFPSHRVLA